MQGTITNKCYGYCVSWGCCFSDIELDWEGL